MRYALTAMIVLTLLLACSSAEPVSAAQQAVQWVPCSSYCSISLDYRECHSIVAYDAYHCYVYETPDGMPCWAEPGHCEGGHCITPVCAGTWPAPSSAVCTDDLQCDDGNPCTWDDCPEPGCEPCHHAPEPDGTVCGLGMTCHEGACCAP